MARLRFLLACLVMLAIPLQGLAATTMMLCASGAAHQVRLAGDAPGHSAAHDHTSQGHGHADHLGAVQAHDHGSPDASVAVDDKADSGPGHKCGACSACCHPASMAGAVQWMMLGPVPQAQPTQAPLAVHSRPDRVPDKPPRA